ncbi:MAG: hypothetical protein IJR55_04685 [Clostridia bacterium]|nr:hypothetical protein [Clostridia bacterium]
MNDTIKIKNKYNTKIIAHRGVSGLETENTCSAFVAAGNRSYYGIETDVHLTADGKFIICHDSSLKRVAGEDIIIEETKFDDLRKIILFNKDGQKSRGDLILPTLEEYISICQKYSKRAVLEIKGSDSNPVWPAEALYRMADTIDKLGYIMGTTFISFGFENLAVLRGKSRIYDMQFLCSNTDFDDHLGQMIDLRIGADIGDYYRFNHSDEAIRIMHNEGLQINCWTVDDPERAEKYASWGVDFITSNILE